MTSDRRINNDISKIISAGMFKAIITTNRYYHYDCLGNVINVTDENGLVLVNNVLEAFGYLMRRCETQADMVPLRKRF